MGAQEPSQERLRERIRELELKGEERAFELDQARAQLYRAQEEIGRAADELRNAYVERDAVLADLARAGAEISRAADELRSAYSELAGVRAELARTRETLAAMRGSSSWRLTAPLRRALTLLARGSRA